jgi:signal peptidase I
VLKPQKAPTVHNLKESELSLPGPALLELLRATLAKGMSFRFRAKGFSMDPFIRDGDMITVRPLADHSPNTGDVVAFIQEGSERLLVHRVIRIKGNAYLIKGDNSAGADGLIPRANILGWVKRVERDDKNVSLGFGPERSLIAFLTRMGLTVPLVRIAANLRRLLRHSMTVLFVPF